MKKIIWFLILILLVPNVACIEYTGNHKDIDSSSYRIYPHANSAIELENSLNSLYIQKIDNKHSSLSKLNIIFVGINKPYTHMKPIYENKIIFLNKKENFNDTIKTCDDLNFRDYNETHCFLNTKIIINYIFEIKNKIISENFIEQNFITENNYLKENKINCYNNLYDNYIIDGFLDLEVKGTPSIRKTDNGYGWEIDHILCYKDKCLNKNEWWNTSWKYRVKIDISNTDKDWNNYQLKIKWNNDTLNYSHINESCKDFRFYNGTNTGILNHFTECNISGNITTYIKIPFMENNTNTTIYFYYGNDMAESSSNCSGTMIWCDDEGDTSKYTGDIVALSQNNINVKYDDYSLHLGSGGTYNVYSIVDDFSGGDMIAGIVEFWLYSTGGNHQSKFHVRDINNRDAFYANWNRYSVDNKLDYLNRAQTAWPNTGYDYFLNIWEHYQFHFNTSSDTVDWWKNGEKIANDIGQNNIDEINRLRLLEHYDSSYYDNIIVREWAKTAPIIYLDNEETPTPPEPEPETKSPYWVYIILGAVISLVVLISKGDIQQKVILIFLIAIMMAVMMS